MTTPLTLGQGVALIIGLVGSFLLFETYTLPGVLAGVLVTGLGLLLWEAAPTHQRGDSHRTVWLNPITLLVNHIRAVRTMVQGWDRRE